jgi:two-component system response regulator NreC
MIRTVVADDHRLLRTALGLLLDAAPDVELLGEAADVATTEDLVNVLQPDVLLLDVTMSGGAGLEAIGPLREAAPGMQVVVLTMHPDERFGARALRAGASGLVLKERADSDLLPAIRAASAARSAGRFHLGGPARR